MNIEKRLELALNISENIKDGKISPNNLYDLQLHISDALEQVKKLTIPVVSNRIFDSGLRELYRKGYNDGFDNKTDDKLATDLIDKRIDRIKKNYGC